MTTEERPNCGSAADTDQAFLKDACTYFDCTLKTALKSLAECLRTGCARARAADGESFFPATVPARTAPMYGAELKLNRWDAATCLKIAEFFDMLTSDAGKDQVINLTIGGRKWFSRPVQAVIFAVLCLFETRRALWSNPAQGLDCTAIEAVSMALHGLPTNLEEHPPQPATAEDHHNPYESAPLAVFGPVKTAYQSIDF